MPSDFQSEVFDYEAIFDYLIRDRLIRGNKSFYGDLLFSSLFKGVAGFSSGSENVHVVNLNYRAIPSGLMLIIAKYAHYRISISVSCIVHGKSKITFDDPLLRSDSTHDTAIGTIHSDCRTGLPEKSLDVVLLYDAFHDLDMPDDVLKEIHRVLRSNGILSFSDHHMKEE